ncbi:MAG: two-component regulator propeller domain-containing protein [Flavobacteriales bacterium]
MIGFLLALAVCFPARAQVWQVFNSGNAGLPSNTVTGLAIGSDGVVWAATDWGLWRYEAGEWEVFQAASTGLPENTLRCAALDQQGRLWVGTSLHGAAVFDGQEWEVFNTQNSPLPDDQVNAIHVDHQGWLWLGTVSGLACFTGC